MRKDSDTGSSVPRLQPAGALSQRYIMLYSIAGFPYDLFFKEDEAIAFAARHRVPNVVVPHKFQEV